MSNRQEAGCEYKDTINKQKLILVFLFSYLYAVESQNLSFMPKVLCRCGEVIGLGEIPSSNQWMIISDMKITDKDWEDNNLNMSEFYKKMDIVAKCPKCKRLYIYSKGFDNEPEVYNLEE